MTSGNHQHAVELEAVFDTVDSEVGPYVHPDRDNSPVRLQQGNPAVPDLRMERDTTSREASSFFSGS